MERLASLLPEGRGALRGADDDPKGGADDDQDDRNFAKDVQTGGAGVFQRYLPLKAMLTALLL